MTPKGNPAIVGIALIVSASSQAAGTVGHVIGAMGVVGRIAIEESILVPTPFIYVSAHVIQPQRIGGFEADRVGGRSGV